MPDGARLRAVDRILTAAIDTDDADKEAEYLEDAVGISLGTSIIGGGSDGPIIIKRTYPEGPRPFRPHSRIARSTLPRPVNIDGATRQRTLTSPYPSALVRSASWPYTSKSLSRRAKFPRIGKGSHTRIIANGWAFAQPDKVSVEEAMDHVHDICQQYSLGVCLTPAQMAWRLLRRHIGKPPAPLPDFPDGGVHEYCLRAMDNHPYIKISTAPSGVRYRYDKNCAYGYYLKGIPDLGRGRWKPVSDYQGPFGIYELSDGGYIGGFSLAQCDPLRRYIHHGYAWDGDCLAPSPYQGYVNLCYNWPGPLPRLMRRCPVYVVGKAWRHTFDRKQGIVTTSHSWYPPLWLWPVGGLHTEIKLISQEYGATRAWVDNIDLVRPLPEHMIGDEIGQFRFEGLINGDG